MKKYTPQNIIYILFQICGMLILFFTYSEVKAQEAPPKPISIYVDAAEGLNFGAFYEGNSGGTITIQPNGSRSVTGDVSSTTFGVPYSPAVFQIEANPGTIISILNGPDVTLTGSNGGSMVLEVGDSDPSPPFITTAIAPDRTDVMIGGTLIVGSPLANPPGVYSGTFSVTFIQE